MRIHTSLGFSAICIAAKIAKVDLIWPSDGKPIQRGSRTHDHAFEVKLEGASRRRPNGGSSGAGSGYAATWDQWGVFLGHIFRLDENAKCWAYTDADEFHYRTNNRFDLHENLTANASLNVAYSEGLMLTYWPHDAHGDHTFRFAGVPCQQSCTKCSAVTRWSF